jgi:hypothetical protein
MLARQLGKSWKVKLYNEDDPLAFQRWRLRDLDTIQALVAQGTAPLTLFKSQQDTHRTPLLLARFPNARILFLLRHYDDVVNSARRKFWMDYNPEGHKIAGETPHPIEVWVKSDFAEFAGARPPEETIDLIKSRWHPGLNLESNIALHWLFRNRLFFDLRFLEDKRIRLVQYETLVSDPRKNFEEICRFLGIQMDEVMVNDVFSSSIRRNTPPELDPQVRKDCEELWQRFRLYYGEEPEPVLAQPNIYARTS